MMGLFEFLVTLFHPARLIRLLVLLVFLHLSLFSAKVFTSFSQYLLTMGNVLFVISIMLLYDAWRGALVFRKVLKERDKLRRFDRYILSMNGLSFFPFVFFRHDRIHKWLYDIGILDLFPLVMYVRYKFFDFILLLYLSIFFFFLFINFRA